MSEDEVHKRISCTYLSVCNVQVREDKYPYKLLCKSDYFWAGVTCKKCLERKGTKTITVNYIKSRDE